ncbi:MAG: HAD-IA family hydrolase [Candidatus Saccharibacteria bacterium]
MRTLLFDFDGTIADSFTVVAEIFYTLTGHERIEDPAVIARLRKLPMTKVVKELHVPPLQIPRMLMKGRKMMSDHLHEVPVFKDIPETLLALRENGYEMYIMSSNSTQNVQRYLQITKLDTYFTKVYGGIGLLNKASAIRKVMRQNGMNRHDCVYIGDELRDVDGAKRAGVPMISVGWGYNDPELLASHHPDVLVMQPQELLAAVEKV